MKTPRGFELDTKGDTTELALKLHKNVYGQNKSDRVCYQHLVRKLMKKIGLTRSTVERYLFYRG